MADPTVVQCESACTITVHHEIDVPPLSLSLAEASQIAGAILVVWAIGFGARAVVRVLNPSGQSGEE